MSRHLLIIAFVLGAAGCSDVPWAGGASATPLVEAQDGLSPGSTIRDALDMIGLVLDSAISRQLDEEGVRQLRRAEFLTDRILEAEIPFDWLATSDYSIEARIWQIQAQADRIVARLRASARRDELLPEIQTLRADIAALRDAIGAGGRPEPAPVERLLQQLDSVTRPPPTTGS